KRDDSTDMQDMGRLMAETAKAYWRLGEAAEAKSLLDIAGNIAQQTHDRSLVADVSLQHGRFTLAEGNLQQATEDLNHSLELYQQLDDLTGMADSMTTLGQIHAMNGEYEQGKTFLTRSLEMYRALGQVRGVAHAYFSLADLAAGSGDLEQADHYLKESLALTKTLGTPSFEGAILTQMGMVAYFHGDSAAARQNTEDAYKLFNDTGDL